MLKSALVLVATLACTVLPAHAFLPGDDPDSYAKVETGELLGAYQDALASAGVSSTGNLHAFHTSEVVEDAAAAPKTDKVDHIIVHAVQDRGLPRGTEYPTYVFTSSEDLVNPALVFKTHAGTRLYLAENIDEKTGCLLSAEQGWSDICLADLQGNPAPDLPGLREDFWSDLLKVFGF